MRPDISRRVFLQAGGAVICAAGFARTGLAAALAPPGWSRPGGRVPPNQWWAGGGPRQAPRSTSIVEAGEPGERLVVSGTVFGPDGQTPLRGVTVYVYQTDVHGLYNPDGKYGAPHRIRGWANTDEHGRYEFRTIKPGLYPNRTSAAHIHMTVCRQDMPEWWLPEVRFEGDRLLTPDDYGASSAQGRFGNVRPLLVKDGILHCARDLRL